MRTAGFGHGHRQRQDRSPAADLQYQEKLTFAKGTEVWPDALKELRARVATGTVKYRETVSQGLDTAPEALICLFKGRTFGKQLVKFV